MTKLRRNKKEKLFSSKKASLFDLVIIAAALLVFTMSILFGFKIVNEFNTNIQGNSDVPARAVTAVTSLEGNYSGVLDGVVPFVAIGLALVTLVLAALVRIHPIFIPLYFIGWVIVIFLSGIYSMVYQNLAADPELVTLADQLILTNAVMGFLPFIVGIVGIMLMVIMYKTWQVEQ